MPWTYDVLVEIFVLSVVLFSAYLTRFVQTDHLDVPLAIDLTIPHKFKDHLS
jgi:hypothetical protein